jgi:hypothetical protein
MTIISEALLAIGTIMVAIAFVFVGGNIVSFQSEGLFSSTQNQLSQEVSGVVNGLPDTKGSFSTTYEPSIGSYTLTVQEHRTVVAEIPGQESSSTTFLDYYLENTRISDAEQICVSKSGSRINFSEGNCDSGGLSNFCADGRCVNDICQPGKGETCSNSGGDCMCPVDAESDEASGVCDSDYEAESFIDADTSGEDTTELGCVKKDYVDVQEVGEQCSQDFECVEQNDAGTQVTCNPSAPSGPSGNYCCPSGLSYAGSGQGCKFVNRFHLVFVPLQYGDGENSQFESWVEDEYLDMWLDDLPVERSEIRVDIIEPNEVDNSAIQSSGNGDCPTGDINLVLNEANSHVSSNYDHAVGIYKDTSQCGLAYCGDYENEVISKGSVSSSENPSIGWGPTVAAQEIAHNWGFNHIPPYECNSLCGGQRKYSCPTDKTSDYMQNSGGPLNDYFDEEEDCIKELFKSQGWAQLPDFSKSDSSCQVNLIS